MEKPHEHLLALNDLDDLAAPLTSPGHAHPDESESLVYRRIRRQVVRRGLTGHRDGASTKEGHQCARITRLQRQLAIIEKFQREKAREKIGQTPHESSLKDTPAPAGVVSSQQAAHFPRKISLRQLPSSSSHKHSNNQLEEGHRDSHKDATSSPTTSDVEYCANLSPQAISTRRGPASEIVRACTSPPGQHVGSKKRDVPAPRAHLDKSTSQVLCELKITKDIMMREHLVKQIHETATTLNQLGAELHDLAQRRERIDVSSGNVLTGSLSRRQSRSASGQTNASGPHMKQQQKTTELSGVATLDSSGRDCEASDFEGKHTSLIHKSQHRMTQLHRLTTSLQTTTMDLVESILEWRAGKSNPSAISNIQKLHRFGWKKRSLANYLVHLDSDLRDLFPSTAMSVLLGASAKYNPLLLPRVVLDTLGVPDDMFVSTTFLTDRRDVRQSVSGESNTPPSPTRRQAFVALNNAVKTVDFTSPLTAAQPRLDADRVRSCLEAIQQEQELEHKALEAFTTENHRLASAYNPFESIKMAGGVEETISTVLAHQVEAETRERVDQLRRRQEDASRAKEHPRDKDAERDNSSVDANPLYVNPGRIRRLIEQRKEVREAATECELHDTTAIWNKNKLRGQVMVRKMNIRRMENQHARKIQRQFLVYRRRTQLLKNLAHFVMTSRQRVVSIQKVVRGFIAKKRYQAAKYRADQQRIRHLAVKTIWHAYKRYKRRVRHRHSMSVEAVAQIQLLHVIQHQLEEADDTCSAERYRKVGEERRRQRAVHLYKRRQELLELEAKRAAAAVRIQSIYRMHMANKVQTVLRGERRAHMTAVSAMMIQSKIRRFLNVQEKRRQRFRSDMERVNRSAVRIQSIYRGYNSRASLMGELSELAQSSMSMYGPRNPVEEYFEEEEDEMSSDEDEGDGAASVKLDREQSCTVLPLLVRSRPAPASSNKEPPAPEPADELLEEDEDVGDAPTESLHAMVARTSARSPPKLSLPPIRPRAQSVEHSAPVSAQRKAQPPPVRRQLSNGMMKVELKLKETTLGDDLEETAAGANSGCFVGPFRRRSSGTNGSYRRNSGESSGSGSSLRGNIPSN